MHRSISLFAILAVGWLSACTTPAEPDGAPQVWLEGPMVWVGYELEVMSSGFLPGKEHTVVYTTPDEPGEVMMILLGPSGGGGLPMEFVKIPSFPEEGGNVAAAEALLASLGLEMQLYTGEGDDLDAVKGAASDSEVVSNHPSSPAGTTVAPGTTVGVVIIISRAAPGT